MWAKQPHRRLGTVTTEKEGIRSLTGVDQRNSLDIRGAMSTYSSWRCGLKCAVWHPETRVLLSILPMGLALKSVGAVAASLRPEQNPACFQGLYFLFLNPPCPASGCIGSRHVIPGLVPDDIQGRNGMWHWVARGNEMLKKLGFYAFAYSDPRAGKSCCRRAPLRLWPSQQKIFVFFLPPTRIRACAKTESSPAGEPKIDFSNTGGVFLLSSVKGGLFCLLSVLFLSWETRKRKASQKLFAPLYLVSSGKPCL